MCANALEWKILSLKTAASDQLQHLHGRVVSISNHSLCGVSMPQTYSFHPDPYLPWAAFEGGSCRVPLHHQLEMWSSPVPALHSHPLCPILAKGSMFVLSGVFHFWVSPLRIWLHCLHPNAAYMGLINYFFLSPLAVHLMEEKAYFWGEYVGTVCILWHAADMPCPYMVQM